MSTKTNLIQTIKTVLLALVLAGGIQVVLAYTDAPASPPNDNVPAPLNVGSTLQTKLGSLHLNSDSVSPVGLTVNQGVQVTSVTPDSTRIYLNEYGDGPGNYSGVELKNNGVFKGGFFKKGTTDEVQIWNGVGPIMSVDSSANTTFAGQIKIVGGNPAPGYVLVAVDSTGLARWEPLNCTPN